MIFNKEHGWRRSQAGIGEENYCMFKEKKTSQLFYVQASRLVVHLHLMGQICGSSTATVEWSHDAQSCFGDPQSMCKGWG